jgi:hypothetical protein
MSEAKAQSKGKKKNKGKGKDKAKGNSNPVRDGSPEPAPVRELAAGRNGADHWDALRRAWAGYLSQQPKNSQGGDHQPHHPNQRRRQQQQNHQHYHHHHPGGQQTESGSVQSRRNLRSGGGGGDGHSPTDRKRKAVATNGTADDGGERAVKRHKGNSRPSDRGAGAGAGAGAAPEPHPVFWHPDGSVIVEVGRTDFKLHQSTLQRHSAYFADAFRNREGHQSGRGRTHLPVYQVDETTAEDFASLLTVIEEPMCVRVLLSFLATIIGRHKHPDNAGRWADVLFGVGGGGLWKSFLGSMERSRPRCPC